MLRTVRLIRLSLVFFVLFGAFSGPVGAAETGIFRGIVTDISEKPVAGAEVFVYRNSNTRRPPDFIAPPTNRQGQFAVTLPAAHYWVVARLRKGNETFGPLLPGDKHSGVPFEIDIEPGETLEEDFVVADLEDTSRLLVKYDTSYVRIEGRIQDKEGKPLANVYAFANSEEKPKRIPDYISAWTGNDGRYALFLPPGEYFFGSAGTFPPVRGEHHFTKVMVDSDAKNINIVRDE